MYSIWEQVASKLEREEGAFINWDERFFVCPNCEEIIYEEDMTSDACPVCGYLF